MINYSSKTFWINREIFSEELRFVQSDALFIMLARIQFGYDQINLHTFTWCRDKYISQKTVASWNMVTFSKFILRKKKYFFFGSKYYFIIYIAHQTARSAGIRTSAFSVRIEVIILINLENVSWNLIALKMKVVCSRRSVNVI